MATFILINKISVQNANAAAGLTWGFPAITNFLGYVHHLQIKLKKTPFDFANDIGLLGAMVVSHSQQVHTFGEYNDRFVQSKNPPYLPSHSKKDPPPIIEEAKMNMVVSLVIPVQGYIGENQQAVLKEWLLKQCYMQRLAGGTILNIEHIECFNIDTSEEKPLALKQLKRKLMPGFVLCDRSNYLEDYYLKLKEHNNETEILDAWLDFSALRYRARPVSVLVSQHIKSSQDEALQQVWQSHLEEPYHQDLIPQEIQDYFSQVITTKTNKALLEEWHNYCNPTVKTNADWERLDKPYKKGWLVPIMCGYKAISPVYKATEMEGTRDNETDVCFVEAAHSIGEWFAVNRIGTTTDLIACCWHYHYEPNWYLCKPMTVEQINTPIQSQSAFEESDYS